MGSFPGLDTTQINKIIDMLDSNGEAKLWLDEMFEHDFFYFMQV